MRLLLVAVGTRMPAWVTEGFQEFARRMPRELPLELIEVRAEPRAEGKPLPALMAAEARRLRAALPARCRRIALDERGDEITTRTLAARIESWMTQGDDVAFLVGGADGLDPAFRDEAQERIRISGLTLPHALVRVILAEALYRATSLLRGHPYHRE
ncbi:MAG: 23S rRNA (pseudouridine(1915)-N(3))-methyltransferase RlmH [Proteobacteria bacterium]|nr:23S rRNA (pseudouridine(1915)-N(3))-methyltransferase RlmH [Pseudomonadota bacterium]HQR05148.1 23S rRNA (pseudouridine(1915)-N(3))-methyltransferase RlmH [Rhodocyclaceae bacterium]